MDAVEVYKLVLERKRIKIFPAGFWQQPEAIDNAIKCTKYLIEEKLKLSEEELNKQLSVKLFKENGLRGMLYTCFNDSPYEAIKSAYPEKNYQPWEFNIVPKGYWDDINNGINSTKWLIETKLKLSEEELKEQLTFKLFKDNGLGGMLQTCFNGSVYEALKLTYPEKNYQPWEFKQVSKGYWDNVENGINATKWLIETKLQLSEQELKEQLSVKLFYDNGLITILRYCFNNSPYEAINKAYPERNYKPWDFGQVPTGYWNNIENGINATKWLIETKLQLSEEELKEQLSTKLFQENGLSGMLQTCFNSSSYEAINTTYPEKNYQPWEFNQVPISYWDNIDNGIKATKWLIETRLQLSEEDLKEQLSFKLFKENGLGGMLHHCFNGSPYEAIRITYPERNYKPWEFNIVPNGYWNDINNGIKVTKWLIETKLKLSEKELREQLSTKLFQENGFGGMLNTCFNASPYEAINTIYPEKNYQPWEFKNVPTGYWNDIENGINATKWLIETKLQLSEEELKEQLSFKLFQANRLGNMLISCFDGSPYEAINTAYPNKFKKSDFKNYK